MVPLGLEDVIEEIDGIISVLSEKRADLNRSPAARHISVAITDLESVRFRVAEAKRLELLDLDSQQPT